MLRSLPLMLYIGTKKGAESRIVKSIPQPITFVAVLSRGVPKEISEIERLMKERSLFDRLR